MRTKTMNNSNNTSVQVHNFEFVRIFILSAKL